MDKFYVRTVSDGKLYNLGDIGHTVRRSLSIVLTTFPLEELEFLREADLTDIEEQNTLWVPSVFVYLYQDWDDVLPVDEDIMFAHFGSTGYLKTHT
ncbi:hypothetical protein bcgnr5390_61190 [Bacillus luti]|nr:hypothetical protein BC2903_60890 [Bacillus cereus]